MPPGSLPTNEDPLVLGRQNYMVYSLRDLIISCVAIDWNLELKSNFCIPLTLSWTTTMMMMLHIMLQQQSSQLYQYTTVLGSQFGREWPEDPASDPPIHVDQVVNCWHLGNFFNVASTLTDRCGTDSKSQYNFWTTNCPLFGSLAHTENILKLSSVKKFKTSWTQVVIFCTFWKVNIPRIESDKEQNQTVYIPIFLSCKNVFLWVENILIFCHRNDGQLPSYIWTFWS